MPPPTQNGRLIRFGVFQVDLQAGELRKSGFRVKLQDQPFKILALLLERPGEVITREELQQKLWSADTFVEFDHGLNSAVKKLRQALGDDSDNPRFVETLPRRGYRFIGPIAGSLPGFPGADSSAGPQTTLGRSSHFGPMLVGAVLLAAGATGYWSVLRAPREPKVLRFTQLTNDGMVKNGPIVTDGSRIYFTEVLPGPRTLVVQVSVAGGEVVPLSVPLKQPRVMDLSKDGTELLIGNDDGVGQPSSFWIQPVAGGSPRRVGTVLAEEAEFGADSSSVIYGDGHDVYSANRDGSSVRKLFTTKEYPHAFRFSPDGKVLRFSLYNEQRNSNAVMETAADGSSLRKISVGCCGEWTADGRFFVFQHDDVTVNLWALLEKPRFFWQKRSNKPIRLTAGPLNFDNASPGKDGKRLFALASSPRAEVVRYDSRTRQFVPYLSGISAEGLAFSRDGQWVTYTSYPDGSLWRSKVDGSEKLQLSFPPLRAFLPRWSPDRKQIAFNATVPGGPWNIYLISSEGGTPQKLTPSEQSQMDATWSPDGNSVAFGSLSEPDRGIYVVDLKSRHLSTLPGSAGMFSPRWSPDGRYIAAIVTKHPFKLMLFEFATQKWTEVFGRDIGYLSWSRDCKYIYFQALDPVQNIRESIVRLRLSDGKVEQILEQKDIGRLATGTITDWFGLAPDDSPLFARDIGTQEIYALEMNWP